MSDKPTYAELVEKVALLEAWKKEFLATNMFIRREPMAAAPTALDENNMVLVDDGGATTKLYWQAQAALRSVTFA